MYAIRLHGASAAVARHLTGSTEIQAVGFTHHGIGLKSTIVPISSDGVKSRLLRTATGAPASVSDGFLDRLPRSPPINSASTNDTLTPALPRAAVAALPFVPTSPLPELTVEQFAALNAELRARPQHEGETLRRFGVAGRDARHQLEQHWASRFAADAVLEQRYRSVLAACSSWLDGPS
jgi:hypothetical protein